MGCCGGISILAIIALVVVIIALILDIVGFATISWMVYQITTNSIRVGLWRMKTCVGNTCSEDNVSDSLKTGAFTATQAFEIFAFIVFMSLPFVVGLYVCMSAARTKCMALVAIILCFTACFLVFIGMICWLVYVKDPYVVSYSMGLTLLAAILALIAGLLLIPDLLDDGFTRGPRANRVHSPPNSRFFPR